MQKELRLTDLDAVSADLGGLLTICSCLYLFIMFILIFLLYIHIRWVQLITFLRQLHLATKFKSIHLDMRIFEGAEIVHNIMWFARMQNSTNDVTFALSPPSGWIRWPLLWINGKMLITSQRFDVHSKRLLPTSRKPRSFSVTATSALVRNTIYRPKLSSVHFWRPRSRKNSQARRDTLRH